METDFNDLFKLLEKEEQTVTGTVPLIHTHVHV